MKAMLSSNIEYVINVAFKPRDLPKSEMFIGSPSLMHPIPMCRKCAINNSSRQCVGGSRPLFKSVPAAAIAVIWLAKLAAITIILDVGSPIMSEDVPQNSMN